MCQLGLKTCQEASELVRCGAGFKAHKEEGARSVGMIWQETQRRGSRGGRGGGWVEERPPGIPRMGNDPEG